jgi:hypothetical protein
MNVDRLEITGLVKISRRSQIWPHMMLILCPFLVAMLVNETSEANEEGWRLKDVVRRTSWKA